MLNIYEVFGHDWHEQSGMFCSIVHSFCEANGINMNPVTPYQDEWRTRIKNFREGAGVTTKQMIHFGQLILSGEFKQFDYYSQAENEKRYG